ncbi:hypothetical protein Nepgr_002001 [Nepenthes gracilis]|uniref:14-3-3 domain-containing protein n=1 Tax=Nepenthes gracilis TaxID=150966 RepID=A0AAD3P6B6_NEPGR|nr:hypothetical protein Nepgr_002001 [Nepenthes gracilis]
MASSEREAHVYFAKLAARAKRYEEIALHMEKVVEVVENDELNVEERKLLSAAYKKLLAESRESWCILKAIEQEESRGNEDHVSMISDYRSSTETELLTICDRILKLLEWKLLPSATSEDSKLFYLKMMEYFHERYFEYATYDNATLDETSTLTDQVMGKKLKFRLASEQQRNDGVSMKVKLQCWSDARTVMGENEWYAYHIDGGKKRSDYLWYVRLRKFAAEQFEEDLRGMTRGKGVCQITSEGDVERLHSLGVKCKPIIHMKDRDLIQYAMRLKFYKILLGNWEF